MSLYDCLGSTVWKAHWIGITGAYNSAGWEVARDAHEAGSTLGYSCTGVTQDRRLWDSKHPSSSTVSHGRRSRCSCRVLGKQHRIHAAPPNTVPTVRDHRCWGLTEGHESGGRALSAACTAGAAVAFGLSSGRSWPRGQWQPSQMLQRALLFLKEKRTLGCDLYLSHWPLRRRSVLPCGCAQGGG